MKSKYRTPLPKYLSLEEEKLVIDYMRETFSLHFEVRDSYIYSVRKLKAKEYYRILGFCDALLLTAPY